MSEKENNELIKSITMLIENKKNEILNTKEAAKHLHISTSTLYKLTSQRSIPFHKPNGKMNFFSRDELDAWLLGNLEKPISDSSQKGIVIETSKKKEAKV